VFIHYWKEYFRSYPMINVPLTILSTYHSRIREMKQVLVTISMLFNRHTSYYTKDKNMKADTQTETEIKALIEAAWERYAQQDLEGVLALWTTDPDLTILGVGDGQQICVGQDAWRDALQDQFERLEDPKVTIEWHSISAAGNVAWSAATVMIENTTNGERVALPTQQTAICEKRGGAWHIMQVHTSRPQRL